MFNGKKTPINDLYVDDLKVVLRKLRSEGAKINCYGTKKADLLDGLREVDFRLFVN